jgi:hypothetical protein
LKEDLQNQLKTFQEQNEQEKEEFIYSEQIKRRLEQDFNRTNAIMDQKKLQSQKLLFKEENKILKHQTIGTSSIQTREKNEFEKTAGEERKRFTQPKTEGRIKKTSKQNKSKKKEDHESLKQNKKKKRKKGESNSKCKDFEKDGKYLITQEEVKEITADITKRCLDKINILENDPKFSHCSEDDLEFGLKMRKIYFEEDNKEESEEDEAHDEVDNLIHELNKDDINYADNKHNLNQNRIFKKCLTNIIEEDFTPQNKQYTEINEIPKKNAQQMKQARDSYHIMQEDKTQAKNYRSGQRESAIHKNTTDKITNPYSQVIKQYADDVT